MALQITKATNYGVNATYFKVRRCDIDFLADSVIIQVDGFLDAAARLAGKAAVFTTSYQKRATDLGIDPDDNQIRVKVYTWLKTLPEWEGAADV